MKAGEMIKRARVSCNMPQRVLAQRLRTTQQNVAKFESASSKDIRLSTLERVAEAVGKKLVVAFVEKNANIMSVRGPFLEDL